MPALTQQCAGEIVILCPVCHEPCLYVEGGIVVGRQISFPCYSEKCDGKRRYIKSDLLKKMLDNFKNIYKVEKQFSDSP